ncbi:transglutaminase-like cysteine peptidase [Aestuariivirga sp.]|uniref:transglutaminase-like cysteine peptidase n=1 Tax=Aestuariivirga sp. TaxID=2650926 RepID=UPI003593F7F1
MKFKSIAAMVAVIGFWAILASSAQAQPTSAREFGKTLPPVGYVSYCARSPEECLPDRAKATRIDLTEERWAELMMVNTFVNAKIAPVRDEDLYGQAEFWTMPKDAGDCEDILLMKRRYLHDMGFPLGALRITVVLDETGEGHAVLTVVSRKGDYVLDNRRNEIRRWNDTGYRFLKRQSGRNPKVWVSLVETAPETGGSIQVGSGQ